MAEADRAPRVASSRAPLRDWQGVQRAYLRVRDGAQAASLKLLVERPLRFDRDGVRAAWGVATRPPARASAIRVDERAVDDDAIETFERTPFAGIVQRPRALLPHPTRELRDLFLEEIVRLHRTSAAPALALGGGLDAALVLAAIRECALPLPALLTLSTGLADYDEVAQAEAIARHFSAPLIVVRTALAALLPHAVALTETPLYNLHPVGRLALAQAARARGFDALFTGDGADAACRGAPDLDYVPLVAALTDGAGVQLRAPFLDPVTIAAARGENKKELRSLATALGLPRTLIEATKRGRMMPAIDLSMHLDRAHAARLARDLDEPLQLDSDRARVSWITLSLLARHLEGAS